MLFHVLGPLEAVGAEGPVRIAGRRPRALMSIMLLQPGHVVTLPALVDGIWADDPPASAIANIRTYVHDLRRLLKRAGDSVARLVSHPSGYHVEVDANELDLLRFRALATDGRWAVQRGEHRRGAEILGEALRLWRGRPLEDLPEVGTVISAKAFALEEERWAAALSWVEANLALGRYEDPIPLLRQLIAERPLCERTRCQLVTALHGVGRTAEALDAYQDARHAAIDELGVEPGIELQQLQLAILQSGSTVLSGDSPVRRRLPRTAPAVPSRRCIALANSGRWS